MRVLARLALTALVVPLACLALAVLTQTAWAQQAAGPGDANAMIDLYVEDAVGCPTTRPRSKAPRP